MVVVVDQQEGFGQGQGGVKHGGACFLITLCYLKKKFHETVRITKAVFTKARYQHAQGLKRRKQVAITLYYLSDKGRYRKVANAFGVARSTVSKVVRRVCFVISKE